MIERRMYPFSRAVGLSLHRGVQLPDASMERDFVGDRRRDLDAADTNRRDALERLREPVRAVEDPPPYVVR